jgi:hypothetical protein
LRSTNADISSGAYFRPRNLEPDRSVRAGRDIEGHRVLLAADLA